jgi:hypothetical protein
VSFWGKCRKGKRKKRKNVEECGRMWKNVEECGRIGRKRKDERKILIIKVKLIQIELNQTVLRIWIWIWIWPDLKLFASS